jgi:chromosome partitioning protein
MPVIAVVNPKGGSGKSTLATHLAAHGAHEGLSVMLGDVDRQKSTLVWLRSRSTQSVAKRAPITSWVVDPSRVLRPPSGVTHVVLDTPGGLHGHELARTIMCSDAIVMPVCDSAFDRDAAEQCWAELQSHPRVASGRCRVAAVGMRIDTRTKAHEKLLAWARGIGLPFLGVLRDTQLYVRCIERGLTIFDLPFDRTRTDREQWDVILDWLDVLWSRRELATPSQADALVATAANADEPVQPVRNPADAWVEGPPPVRVTPVRRPPAPQLRELAAALAPRSPPPPRGWLAQALGWLPARLAR